MKIVDLGVKADADHAILWQDGMLFLLDQRVLPQTEQYLQCETVQETAEAIREMVVRGAPAIGIAAAFGVVLAARAAYRADAERWRDRIVREGGETVRLFCEQSGASAETIEELLSRIQSAPGERIEKGLRRQLFREIHDALMTAARDDRISR